MFRCDTNPLQIDIEKMKWHLQSPWWFALKYLNEVLIDHFLKTCSKNVFVYVSVKQKIRVSVSHKNSSQTVNRTYVTFAHIILADMSRFTLIFSILNLSTQSMTERGVGGDFKEVKL